MKRYCCLFLLVICLFSKAIAQEKAARQIIPKRQYFTSKSALPIKLDGVPTEPAWDAVAWSEDFTEYQPNENTPPAQQTHFKILYDNKYLYIAYQALDSVPSAIVKRMGRRDAFPGDWVEINIDSYHDLRTAFSFTLSASGVRGDELISNNGTYWDSNWNPIWYAKTHIGDDGWTAEIKIPLSQLRFGNEPEKVWGIQVQRMVFRKDERSTWQYIPQNAGAWVSEFGELRGLKNIPAQKQIEIAPYVVAQTAKFTKEVGNPFDTVTDNTL